MKGKYNLLLAVVLILVTLTFAIGSGKNWTGSMAIGLMIYYFTFLINLFKKVYRKENILTKIFFSYPRTPMYISTIMLLTIQAIERANINLELKPAYASVVVGFIVGFVAIIKGRKLEA